MFWPFPQILPGFGTIPSPLSADVISAWSEDRLSGEAWQEWLLTHSHDHFDGGKDESPAITFKPFTVMHVFAKESQTSSTCSWLPYKDVPFPLGVAHLLTLFYSNQIDLFRFAQSQSHLSPLSSSCSKTSDCGTFPLRDDSLQMMFTLGGGLNSVLQSVLGPKLIFATSLVDICYCCS